MNYVEFIEFTPTYILKYVYYVVRINFQSEKMYILDCHEFHHYCSLST